MKRLFTILTLLSLVLFTACSQPQKETVTGAREVGVFQLACYDASGALKWQETAHNALADEGEEYFLGVGLRGTTMAANTYLRLFNDTPAETDGISDLTGEIDDTYLLEYPKTLSSDSSGWPTLALDSGDYMATSDTVTFTTSGGPAGPATYLILTTSTDSSGKLISYAALSASRTLQDGDSLQVTYKLKMQ